MKQKQFKKPVVRQIRKIRKMQKKNSAALEKLTYFGVSTVVLFGVVWFLIRVFKHRE